MGQSDKRENVWLNLGFNIILPSIFLIKGAKIAERFGYAEGSVDLWIFVVALAFPIIYGAYDLISRKKWNVFSVIGVLSVVLTGGIGLMKFSREWMIAKEAAVPLILGLVVLFTAPTKKPLAKILLMNDSVVNVGKIDSALVERGTKAKFEGALRSATYILASSFLLSSILNFSLASWIFQSEPGTAAFNEEVGRMTALSFPVIMLPTMIIFIVALYRLFSSITSLTGYKLEEIMAEGASKK